MLLSLFVSLLLGTQPVESRDTQAISIGLNEAVSAQGYEMKEKMGERAREAVIKELEARTFVATVTAYNTVPGQTDSSPCVGAGGWICGRKDVAACPRRLPFGSRVYIEDVGTFVCVDRLAERYDARVDISFDQDVAGALRFGRRVLEVRVL